jgi:hypothetical protein
MSVQGMHGRVAASGTESARHRADRSPGLLPHVRPARRAHLDPRRHLGLRWAMALALALLLVTAVGWWRLLGDEGESATRVISQPHPTARISTTASLDQDGDVHVSLDVVRSNTLAMPVLLLPDRPGTGFEPQVTMGRLLADSVAIAIAGTLAPGDAVEVPARAARATRLVLDYTATGTYVASRPSPPGRGLVLLTPVRLAGDDLPGRVEVTDARILNLGCVRNGALRVCGDQTGDTWVVEDLVSGEDVVGQVDLGRAGAGATPPNS